MTTLSLKYGEEDRIVRLTIDSQGPVNTLDAELTASLDKILDEIGGLNAGGIVIHSAKKGSFITGADLKDLTGLSPKELARVRHVCVSSLPARKRKRDGTHPRMPARPR